MPSGRTHLKITTAIQAAGLPLFFYTPFPFALGWHIGCWVSRYVNNDLDITVSRLPKAVQVLGFSLYKEIVPHRAGLYRGQWRNLSWNVIFFSHVPVVGTALRFVLVLYVPVILLLLLGSVQLLTLAWVGETLVGVFSGMSTSDAGHTSADIVVTGLKKLKRWLVERANRGRVSGKRKRKAYQEKSHLW